MTLRGFNDRMMVSPGVLQAMREKFNGLGSLGAEDQKACGGSADATDHP
jgi:hypothetical protein